MQINIDNLLQQKGKTRYWLAKEVGISYPTMKYLADNKTEGTKFDTIEKICIALDCTPNDLLKLTKP